MGAEHHLAVCVSVVTAAIKGACGRQLFCGREQETYLSPLNAPRFGGKLMVSGVVKEPTLSPLGPNDIDTRDGTHIWK